MIFLILMFGVANAKPFDELNYKYGIFFAKTLSDQINPSMPIDEILKVEEQDFAIRDSVVRSLKASVFPLIKFYSPDMLAQTNITNELVNGLMTFSEELKQNLKQIKNTHRRVFQLMIVPTLSDELIARRRSQGEVPIKRFYSEDKFTIYEPLDSHEETYRSARDVIVTEMYNGMTKLMEYHALTSPKNPFFLSISMNIILEENPGDSLISSQITLGLPINKSMPFTESNEEIEFQLIEFPTIKGSFSASKYPCAFINVSYKLDDSPAKMLINFGPMGTYKGYEWVRPNNQKLKYTTPPLLRGNFNNMVPRLVGKPKAAKGILKASFNIYNLVFNLEKAYLEDIDLFISLNFANLSGLGVGSINKPDVDNQFRDEINKTIQSKIDEQKQKLSKKELKQAASSKLSPKQLSGLLDALFSIDIGGE